MLLLLTGINFLFLMHSDKFEGWDVVHHTLPFPPEQFCHPSYNLLHCGRGRGGTTKHYCSHELTASSTTTTQQEESLGSMAGHSGAYCHDTCTYYL